VVAAIVVVDTGVVDMVEVDTATDVPGLDQDQDHLTTEIGIDTEPQSSTQSDLKYLARVQFCVNEIVMLTLITACDFISFI